DEDAEGTALAGAVGTEEAEQLARPQRQVEAVDGDEVTVAHGEVRQAEDRFQFHDVSRGERAGWTSVGHGRYSCRMAREAAAQAKVERRGSKGCAARPWLAPRARGDSARLLRQCGLSHQIAVALARRAAAFVDCPHDETLAAAHVASREHAW